MRAVRAVPLSRPRPWHLFPIEPAQAWVTILGFVVLTALLILVRAGSLVQILFPAGALGVGIFLYWRYPLLYLGFLWWLWFLTPWVRRLVDYQSGWTDPSPVLLAPFLATGVTLLTLLRYLPAAYHQRGLPYILSLVGVAYAILVGLILNPVSAVLLAALNWSIPLLFGFHLLINWREYPAYRQNLQRVFTWGILVMGIYGVVQFLFAPEWDRFWLENVIRAGSGSFGSPEPLGIRVFSTMNSPGPFAQVLMTGLLLLLSSSGSTRFFSMAVGYLAFLLTLVRSAWGGWTIGFIVLVGSLKPKLQARLLMIVIVLVLCVAPLTTIEPFAQVIQSRVQTLSNVQEDGSYQARSETYNTVFTDVLLQPLGNGFGKSSDTGEKIGYDSAFIDLFLSLGWLGTALYASGLVLMGVQLIQVLPRRTDPFLSAAAAISTITLAQLPFGNALTGVSGVILWGFLGLMAAGLRYHDSQTGGSR